MIVKSVLSVCFISLTFSMSVHMLVFKWSKSFGVKIQDYSTTSLGDNQNIGHITMT